MNIFRSSSPVADAEDYGIASERELNRLPACSDCGEPIQQDKAVYWRGEWICDECLSEARRDVLAG